MQEWADLARILLAAVLMIHASRQDWRERMADDLHWLVMGFAGLSLMTLYAATESLRWEYYIIILATMILFLDVFWDNEGIGKAVSMSPYALALILLGYAIGVIGLDGLRYEMVTPFILYWVFITLYLLDIIKGGADAKCLISLSLLFPLYPVVAGLPLIVPPSVLAQSVLPFPVMVLFLGSLLSLSVLPYFIVRNLLNRDLSFPLMLLGTRMDLDRAENGHYWPMERVSPDGSVLRSMTPQKEDFDALRNAGAERIWVTPKVPLLVPMTVAMLVIIVVGNPLFLFF